MTIQLPILPGTLPPGYCFQNWQQTLNDFAENMTAQLEAGMAFYNYGDTVPDPEFNTYPWLRTTDMRWYMFSGAWISPNPEQSLYVRRIWEGSTVNLGTYDGGDAGAPSDRSGPMWEVASAFEGRSLMGVGDISGSDPAKTLSLSEDYGAGSKTLSLTQMPEHQHTFQEDQFGRWRADANTPAGDEGLVGSTVGAAGAYTPTSDPAGGDGSGGTDPFSIVHPVRGVYIIKRTARIFYRV